MDVRQLDTTLKRPTSRRRVVGVIVAGLSAALGGAVSADIAAAKRGKNRRQSSHTRNSSNATSTGIGGAGGSGGAGGDAHIPCIPGLC